MSKELKMPSQMKKIIQQLKDSKMPTENTPSTLKTIIDRFKEVFDYKPKVAILGKTGVGKSTLMNALFGANISPTSPVKACTRNVISHDLGKIEFLDMPGIGENKERDADYIPKYLELFKEADLVLWVIKTEDRAYAEIQNILEKNTLDTPIVFVLSNADKVPPSQTWDWAEMLPSDEQKDNIIVKEREVSRELKVPVGRIVTIACDEQDVKRAYNLKVLLEKIEEVLPNKKKHPYTKPLRRKQKVSRCKKKL